MKIEIDLKEILTDEYGSTENLAESIRRQIIERLSAEAAKGIKAQIDEEVSRVLREELQVAVKEKMPALVNDLLNAEYTPVNQYGSLGKKTTLRTQLIDTIASEMIYKKTSSNYDRNTFTKAVDEVIAENVRIMQRDFDKTVIAMFQKEAFEYAMKKMAEKLQVQLVKADLAQPAT